MLLWHVLDGPYETPHSDNWHLLGKVQMDDNQPVITKEELVFSTFESAYAVMRYFDYNINPLSTQDITNLVHEAEEEEQNEEESMI